MTNNYTEYVHHLAILPQVQPRNYFLAKSQFRGAWAMASFAEILSRRRKRSQEVSEVQPAGEAVASVEITEQSDEMVLVRIDNEVSSLA